MRLPKRATRTQAKSKNEESSGSEFTGSGSNSASGSDSDIGFIFGNESENEDYSLKTNLSNFDVGECSQIEKAQFPVHKYARPFMPKIVSNLEEDKTLNDEYESDVLSDAVLMNEVEGEFPVEEVHKPLFSPPIPTPEIPLDLNDSTYILLLSLFEKALCFEFQEMFDAASSTMGLNGKAKSCIVEDGKSKSEKLGGKKCAQNSRSTEVIENVFNLKMKGKRIACPFSYCTKDFLNFEGIKYHLNNVAHVLNMDTLQEKSNDIRELHKKILELQQILSLQIFPIFIPCVFKIKSRRTPSTLLLKLNPWSTSKDVKVTSTRKKKSDSADTSVYNPILLKTTVSENKVKKCRNANYITRNPESFLRISKTEWIEAFPTPLPILKAAFSRKGKVLSSNPFTRIAPFQSLEPGLDDALMPFLDQINCRGIICNPCISVWALDWASGNENSDEQYVALGGYLAYDEHHIYDEKQISDLVGCIQIWRVGKSAKLVLGILHDYGRVLDLKWSPSNAFDVTKGRIGFLAGVFGDGSCKVLDIPLPKGESCEYLHSSAPFFEASFDHCVFTKVCWSSSNKLAIGCSNGFVAVWCLDSLFLGLNMTIHQSVLSNHPSLFTPVHDYSVTGISFKEMGALEYIVTSSTDGRGSLTNLKNPGFPIHVFRHTDICLFEKCGLLVFADENKVTGYDLLEGGQIGSGKSIAYHSGKIWSIEFSSFFPFLASCGDDGCVNITNGIRSINKKAGPLRSKQAIVSHRIYGADYSGEDDCYTFKELLTLQESVPVIYAVLRHERSSVHIVKWNPNYESRFSIASGGVGWFRIDSGAN